MRPLAATLILLAAFLVPSWIPASEAGSLATPVTGAASSATNPWPDLAPIQSFEPITLEFAALDDDTGALGPWTTDPGPASNGIFRVKAPRKSLVHLMFEVFIKEPDPTDPDYQDLLPLYNYLTGITVLKETPPTPMTDWDLDLGALSDLEVAAHEMNLVLNLVAGNLGSMQPPPPSGDKAALYWFQPVMPVAGETGPTIERHIYLDCPTFESNHPGLSENWDTVAFETDQDKETFLTSEVLNVYSTMEFAGAVEDPMEFNYVKNNVDPQGQGETFLTQAEKLGLVLKVQAIVLSTPDLASLTITDEASHPGLPGLGDGDNLLVGTSAALYVDVISRVQSISGAPSWVPPEIRDPGPHPVRAGETSYLVMWNAAPVNSSVAVLEENTGNIVILPLIDGGPGLRGFTLPRNLRGPLSITSISNFFTTTAVPGNLGGLVIKP